MLVNHRGAKDAERQSRKRGGVRPSSGAATPQPMNASDLSSAVRTPCDAAPEDGRTPGLSEKSSRLESSLDDCIAKVSYAFLSLRSSRLYGLFPPDKLGKLGKLGCGSAALCPEPSDCPSPARPTTTNDIHGLAVRRGHTTQLVCWNFPLAGRGATNELVLGFPAKQVGQFRLMKLNAASNRLDILRTGPAAEIAANPLRLQLAPYAVAWVQLGE